MAFSLKLSPDTGVRVEVMTKYKVGVSSFRGSFYFLHLFSKSFMGKVCYKL